MSCSPAFSPNMTNISFRVLVTLLCRTRFSRMLQRRLAASPALQGHSAAPRPTRRTLHDAGRGTSRPKSARRTPQSGRSSIPRELYAQHVRDGPQLRHRRASQTPAGLIEPAVTVTPGHFLADDSRPMSSQRMITQRSLTSSAVPSSKRKKARHVEVPSLEAGPLAPSARRSSLRVTATPMAKEYAIGLTRDVFQRRADKHLTGHHRELRSELLEMVELYVCARPSRAACVPEFVFNHSYTSLSPNATSAAKT